jgi:hypothetical protein
MAASQALDPGAQPPRTAMNKAGVRKKPRSARPLAPDCLLTCGMIGARI